MANEKAKAQIENLSRMAESCSLELRFGSLSSSISWLENHAKKGDSPVVGLDLMYDQKQRVG